MSSALELAKSFGLEEVHLPQPPGFQAKVRLPSLSELMRKGAMPTDLRRALTSIKPSADNEITDEQMDVGVDMTAIRAARMVRAVRVGDGDWESVNLSIDDFLLLPQDTQDALLEIATAQKTPAMVSALVRRMRGEISDEEAASIVEEETPKLVKGWESFRHDGSRPVGSGDGEGVSPTPISPARHKRAGSRVRAG